MSATAVDRLEARLETLIEGAFARLFPSSAGAREIGLLLLRALDDAALTKRAYDSEPVAPDSFRIHLHPDKLALLNAQAPDLESRLSSFLSQLSRERGYRSRGQPLVELRGDSSLPNRDARVSAAFSRSRSAPTARMPAAASRTRATLRVAGVGVKSLREPIVHIGRALENDIVIPGARVSRRHLQLRRRSGGYTLVDLESRGGTRVNGRRLRRHRLRHGDVIRIGDATLVYAEERAQADVKRLP